MHIVMGLPLEPCDDGSEHRWASVEPARRQFCSRCGLISGSGDSHPTHPTHSPYPTNTIRMPPAPRARRFSKGQRQYLSLLKSGQPDQCTYCEVALTDDNRTIDHRIPVSHGGTDALPNLALACWPCNLAKGDQTDHEFLASRWLRC
jgi:5-methylcytosine-specific restriction endonuclease McrA